MLRACALLLALFFADFFRVLFGLFSAFLFSTSSGLDSTELRLPPPLVLLE